MLNPADELRADPTDPTVPRDCNEHRSEILYYTAADGDAFDASLANVFPTRVTRQRQKRSRETLSARVLDYTGSSEGKEEEKTSKERRMSSSERAMNWLHVFA